MKIKLFNSVAYEIDFMDTFVSIESFILFADEVTFYANTSWANLFTIDLEKISDEQLIALTKDYYADIDDPEADFDEVERLYLEIKKSKNQKHKDRDTLINIGFIRVAFKEWRVALIEDRNEFLHDNHIAGIFPFIEKKIWHVPVIDFINDSKKEDVFIQPITEAIIQIDSIFVVDCIIETLFSFTTLDSMEKEGFDFIKIPMWDMPLTIFMPFEKLKYTREDLQAIVLPFKTHLKELSDALQLLSFSKENMPVIKQMCQEKLIGHIEPVQQSIYNSLYIMQLLNEDPDAYILKFCVAIASAETLINYYEKTNLVVPYVISEIKQQTSRHIDLKASYVFTYFEIPEDIFGDENQEEKSE